MKEVQESKEVLWTWTLEPCTSLTQKEQQPWGLKFTLSVDSSMCGSCPCSCPCSLCFSWGKSPRYSSCVFHRVLTHRLTSAFLLPSKQLLDLTPLLWVLQSLGACRIDSYVQVEIVP